MGWLAGAHAHSALNRPRPRGMPCRHIKPDDKTIIAEVQEKIRKGEMAKPRLHSALAGVDSARTPKPSAEQAPVHQLRCSPCGDCSSSSLLVCAAHNQKSLLASSSLRLTYTLPIAGFVPNSSPGASSYFSPQRMEQETNETFEVLFSAQRNPVIAGLDAEIARNPFRHRTRSSSFHSSPSTHLHSPLSKTVIRIHMC